VFSDHIGQRKGQQIDTILRVVNFKNLAYYRSWSLVSETTSSITMSKRLR